MPPTSVGWAGASGQRWSIQQQDARLAFQGVHLAHVRALGRPSFAVNLQRGAGVRA